MDNQKLSEEMRDFFDFHAPSIISKEVELDYNIQSAQPWTSFICEQNPFYSFRVHDLEIGAQEEATYWHMAGQRDKQAKLEGFESIIPRHNKVRGIISIPKDHTKLGVIVANTNLKKLRTNSELNDNTELSSLIMSYVMMKTDRISSNI